MNVLTRPIFDLDRIRADFPILGQQVHGKPLVFLDSAASAQKPRQVIAAMVEAMETQYANVHRGLHWMSERTTDAYEGVRAKIARMLNAPDAREIVFAKNSTELIPGRRPACVRAWTRLSRCCASACHPRWGGRCARRMPSSR